MYRCVLCKKKTEQLSEHNLCEECEKQFDFSLNPPPPPEKGEPKHRTMRRMIILGAAFIGMIAFFYLFFYFFYGYLGVGGTIS